MNTIKMSKVLALIVVVAMVMAVVPGFTAFAADVTVFDVTTASVEAGAEADAAAGSGVTGPWNVKINHKWSTTGTWIEETPADGEEYGDAALMFFRGGKRQDDPDETVVATLENGSKTAGATAIDVKYNFAAQVANNCYQTIELVDLNGTPFARMYFDIGNGGVADEGAEEQTVNNANIEFGYIRGEDNLETPEVDERTPAFAYIPKSTTSRQQVIEALGTPVEIAVAVGTDSTTVTYTVNGEKLGTDTVPAVINGIGSIQSGIPTWNDQYTAAGLQGLKITATVPDTMVEVTATYKAGEQTITETKSYNKETTPEGVTFEAKTVLGEDGEIYTAPAQTLTADAEITMTKADHFTSKEVGDIITIGDDYYKVAGESIAVNGDFTYGTLNWSKRNGTGEVTGTVAPETVNGTETNVLTMKVEGVDGAGSPGQIWALEPGTTYVLSFDAAGMTKDDKGNFYASVLTGATEQAVRDGLKANISTDADNDLISTWAEGAEFANYSVAVEATEEKAYVGVAFAWMAALKLANVEVIPVEAFMPDDQVEYSIVVKAGDTTLGTIDGKATLGTEIAVAKGQVNGRVGDTYYESPETTVKIEKEGAVEVEAVKVATITGAEPVTATTVGDYEAFLPSAVKTIVETEDETFVPETLPVTWEGNIGTIADTGVTVEANVNELDKTYEIVDTTVYTAQNNYERAHGHALKLPAAVTGDFAIEFTLKVNSLDGVDQWIFLNNADADYFGASQICLGVNANFVAVNGNGTGDRAEGYNPDKALMALEAGKTYTVLVEVDAANNKYDVTIANEAGEVATANDYGFRTNGTINSIVALDNRFSGNWLANDGTFDVTNIQVYQADVTAPAANTIEAGLNYITDGDDKDTLTVSIAVDGDLEGKNLVITALDSTAEHAADTVVYNEAAVAAAALVAKTNVTYDIKVVDAATGFATAATTADIYALVAKDITAHFAEYQAEGSVDANRVANGVEVLTKGGVVYTDAIDSVRSAFITVTADEEAGTTTIAIDEALFKNGFGFKVGVKAGPNAVAAALPEGAEGEVFQSITINADGTATVQAADGAVYTFSLDDVEIEFAATDVAETDAADAAADLGMVDEL